MFIVHDVSCIMHYRSEWPDVSLTPDENRVVMTVNSICAKVQFYEYLPVYVTCTCSCDAPVYLCW